MGSPNSLAEKPADVVQPFSLANDVSWPYDMPRRTSQILAELQSEDVKIAGRLVQAKLK